MKRKLTTWSDRLPAARTGAGGFTLIEIMIALAILGTALFILLDSHYSALRLYDHSWEKIAVSDMMAKAIGEAQAEILAGKRTGDGDFGKRHPGYSYSFSGQSDDENDPSFYTVLVTVNTPDGGANEMTLYFYDTTGGLAASGPLQPGGRVTAGLGRNTDTGKEGASRSSDRSSGSTSGRPSSGSRKQSGVDGRSGAT